MLGIDISMPAALVKLHLLNLLYNPLASNTTPLMKKKSFPAPWILPPPPL
jgi:hypothetical protein